MRIKSIKELANKEPEKIELAVLPTQICMTSYALEKAYKINELVKEVHGWSYEWYGFTIAHKDNIELIIDIGLGKNAENQLAFTRIDPEEISIFREELPREYVINGWVHSHGNLGYRQFSGIDDENHLAVLRYVTSLLMTPVGIVEVKINGLGILKNSEYKISDLEKNIVTLVADEQVSNVKIMQRIDAGFCYNIVVGDEKWHHQSICHRYVRRLTGDITDEKLQADIITVPVEFSLTAENIEFLRKEVKEKIRPYKFATPGWIWDAVHYKWQREHPCTRAEQKRRGGNGKRKKGFWSHGHGQDQQSVTSNLIVPDEANIQQYEGSIQQYEDNTQQDENNTQQYEDNIQQWLKEKNTAELEKLTEDEWRDNKREYDKWRDNKREYDKWRDDNNWSSDENKRDNKGSSNTKGVDEWLL